MKILDKGPEYLMDTVREATYNAFNGAEEIGSSDISCVVNGLLREFGVVETDEGFEYERRMLRTLVQGAI